MRSLILFVAVFYLNSSQAVTVGSKTFTENYIIAEIAAQLMEDQEGVTVTRRFGLGATGIIFEALKAGEIDFYPEYTGTISEAILKNKDIKVSQIASGIPIGGNIEFIDMATLVKSLEGRKSVK